MEKYFKLKAHGTNVRTELIAGLTTFFAMAYILAVNPMMLAKTGLPEGAVFLATVITSAAGTLFMGLFANVPYALAPGMGLNAMFTYTIVLASGYTAYEALGMVFICGVINILVTVTKLRKQIIKAIPLSLQHAIGGGIGIFIAYIGLLNVGILNFSSGVPAFTAFNNPIILVFLFGLILTLILMLLKVKGAILIGIVVSTVIAVPVLKIDLSVIFGSFSGYTDHIGGNFSSLGGVFAKALTEGIPSLLSKPTHYLYILASIFAFSLSDTFDTIGTFIGTGRRTGIFSLEDEKSLETGSGFSSKMDRALFADSIATSIGALFGTSNVTTYVESSAGIEAGGRTGLTAVTVAVLFLLSILLSPIITVIPAAATSPALVVVGILMIASFADIQWADLEEAIPAFFAGVMIALAYSISDGLGCGFIFYVIVKIAKKKTADLNPILIIATLMFILSFVIRALQAAKLL